MIRLHEANSDPTPGYHGQYLHVDVSARTACRIRLDEQILRRFLGGSGLGTWLLLRHGGDGHDATDSAAPIVFAFSPLVGSPLTTSAKFAVASKSPLTGYINDSLVSSAFALAGKRAGVDAIVITGRCDESSVLLVDEQGWQLRPAQPYRGAACDVTEVRLRHDFGPDYQWAVIGPAGESGVRFATISHAGRHAGRGGNGAVLGSKHLKAIGVRGNRRVSWAHTDALLRAAKDLSRRSLGNATAKYRELGTAANLLVLNRLGALPTRNFQQGSFEQAAPLDPVALTQVTSHARTSCAACTIGCEHMYQLAPSAMDGASTAPVRVEYENLYALGPLCGIGDVQAVMTASQLCDQYGIDTISTGATIAFAMECAEYGWLNEPWLRFGDATALLKAIHFIGRGEGIGVDMGRGSRALARQLGPHAEAIAPHVKGLELPGYEPRAAQAMAVGFAVGSRGADHNRSGAYQVDFSHQVDRYHLRPQDVPLILETEDQSAIMDSVIFCKFLRGVFSDFFAETADYLRLITGWEITVHELRETARRIVTVKKCFNIRAGWQPAEDTLPPRLLREAQRDNPAAKLTELELGLLVKAYNRARGWSDQGWIPPTEMIRLQLAEWTDTDASPSDMGDGQTATRST